MYPVFAILLGLWRLHWEIFYRELGSTLKKIWLEEPYLSHNLSGRTGTHFGLGDESSAKNISDAFRWISIVYVLTNHFCSRKMSHEYLWFVLNYIPVVAVWVCLTIAIWVCLKIGTPPNLMIPNLMFHITTAISHCETEIPMFRPKSLICCLNLVAWSFFSG